MLLIQLVLAQFPTDLIPDEISEPLTIYVEEDNEFLLTLTASANTDWSMPNSESATLVVAIDGEWENYNQDIVLYAGNTNHEYYVSLGYLSAGEHLIEFKFDDQKSTLGAEQIHIESANIVNIETLNVDLDVFLYSPILYGRDLLSWNESTHTDIPIIMSYYISESECSKIIEYHIMFSNEDSRVGLGLADLMFSYGRTTDIEWVYRVELDCNGEIIDEKFQGPSHTTTNFNGQKIGQHPILKNATLNCNFTDIGTSDYKFFLAPIAQQSSGTRQILMDENPWSYRIMGEELINENRYELDPNPFTIEMSDVRNYIYIEYLARAFNGLNHTLDLAIKFHGDCNPYFHNHQSDLFQTNASSFNPHISTADRTSIELMPHFDINSIEALGFILNIEPNNFNSIQFYIDDIVKLFYLDDDYVPTDIPINFYASTINVDNHEIWFTINENSMNIDCLGIANGTAECDECNVCNGNNLDLDDCGVCFGNNLDMDCNSECFGSAAVDDCGICDNNLENDNLTCSGCTDSNADNYDNTAIFYDGSCIYSDNIFSVPTEYNSIQDAIFYASDGDIVEVGDGLYYENLNFLDKSIILRSESGLDMQPHIIGNDSLSTITIENSINASVEGLAISNGYGKGVSFDDFLSLAADEAAFDSLVTQVLRGGGISIINSNAYLKNLNITDNTAQNVGAGLGLINSIVTIESSQIIDNYIPDGDALGGGGIAINGGEVTIIDSDISNNIVGSNLYSLNGGGGILCGFSFGENPLSLNMYNTTIFNNNANIGAGLGALSGNISLERVILSNNTGDYGSAISMGEPLGLVVGDINMNLINSTIADNTGLLTTGLINSAYLNILNSIFWNNDGDYEFAPMPNNDQLNIDAYYSIFENELLGEGNLNINPLFADNSYQLLDTSPAIDAGIDYFNFNNEFINIETYYGSAPDIGAYEFQDCNTVPSGDLNNDGMLDILDIIIIVSVIMGDLDLDWNTVCFADMNQDSILDIFDIIMMINSILSV